MKDLRPRTICATAIPFSRRSTQVSVKFKVSLLRKWLSLPTMRSYEQPLEWDNPLAGIFKPNMDISCACHVQASFEHDIYFKKRDVNFQPDHQNHFERYCHI